jgi:Met-zincin/Domain of unknown function (DUF5117)/Domain of unknown function (DUF5118)
MLRTRLLTAIGAALALVTLAAPTMGPVKAQDEPVPQKKDMGALRDAMKARMAKAATSKESSIKPYDEVITSEAKSTKGLFLVHRIADKVFYEIPTEVLGKPMLWVTQIEKTQSGYGYGGSPVGDRVVRWEQRGDDILLRDVRFGIRAEVKDPIKDAVAASSIAAIIEVFPIKAFGKDKKPVIEVTGLFTGDLTEFSARRRLNASGTDARKTFIESVKSYPENIEAKVTVTYRAGGASGLLGPRPGPDPSPDPGPDPSPSPRRRFPLGMMGGGGEGSITVLLHHSMVRLPDEPMKPRKFDSRVGFFTVGFQDFADTHNHQVEDVRYINRWRLEKKDPKADVSEPKKPIVYYIGREVPAKWRPWLKKGIEMWQPAFEKAGYKNAIIAKDAPTLQEDPDWDAEDARYSSIRWLPATIENAMGPHIHDPRTGEILEADIQVYHNVLKLIRDWYFTQAGPNDPRAQSLPLPDELVGECLAYVIAHEVGHTLGFPHNMKGSSSYTVAQLRDPEFTRKNGTEASIMDYGRFNYVAQPGDKATLIPKIGPYDFFALEWGYKEFPDATTYEKEKAALDAIAVRQVKDPTLRFGDPNPSEDPSQQTEDLGSDAVAATELGLKNLDRVAGYLVKAASKKGEDYDLLQNMYDQLVAQRNRELGHVVNVVGGFVRNNVYYGDGDKVYDPVPAEQQKKAVAFLVANGLKTPPSLIAPDIVQRLQATGTADRVLASQTSILRGLLNETRVKRMAELAARDPAAYAPVQLLGDLSKGVFGDVNGSTAIDLYGRNLQRSFVEILIGEVQQDRPTSDLPALARGTLVSIAAQIPATAAATKDELTRIHLLDLKARITQALEPKMNAPASTTIRVANPFGD